MAFAQGSRTGLSYVVESSFGVTPSSPSMTSLPYNSHSLNLSKQRVQGNEIQTDRMPRVDRHGNRQVGGDIVVDLRPGDFDDLIESAFSAPSTPLVSSPSARLSSSSPLRIVPMTSRSIVSSLVAAFPPCR